MAGFGVGVGDIIALGKLGINLYRGCKGANGAYDALSDEVDRFCSIVQSLKNTLPTQQSINASIDRTQNHELHALLRGAHRDLSHWVDLLHKHRNVGPRSRWANMRFAATEDATTIQRHLASHCRSLNLFMSTMTSKRMEHIERHLERILMETRDGTRDFSVQVQQEDDTIIGLDETQWEMLQTELLNDGFVEEDIASHKLWFEDRLRKVDATSISTRDLTPPPTPASPPRPKDSLRSLGSPGSPGPLESVWKPRTPNLSVKCADGKYLQCGGGDRFTFLGVVDIRPGRSDLWQCFHLASSEVVTLEASCLEPGGPKGAQDIFHQFTPPKSSGSTATLKQPTPRASTSRLSKRPSLADSRVSRKYPPRSMNTRVWEEPSTPTTNAPQPNPERRSSSDFARGRSMSASSLPAKSHSRPHSVHSEISEYGPDGNLIKTKTITTSYSSDAVPLSGRRFNLLPHKKPSKSESNNNLDRPGLAPVIAKPIDYESMYKERSSQLRNILTKLVDARVLNADPLSYRDEDLRSDSLAMNKIELRVDGTQRNPGLFRQVLRGVGLSR